MSLVSLFIENHITKRTDLDMLLKHFQYSSKLTGTRHIGIGPDFMDYMKDALSDYIKDHELPITMFTYPQGTESVKDLMKVKRLLGNNFTKNDTEQILCGNFKRIYQNVLSG